MYCVDALSTQEFVSSQVVILRYYMSTSVHFTTLYAGLHENTQRKGRDEWSKVLMSDLDNVQLFRKILPYDCRYFLWL